MTNVAWNVEIRTPVTSRAAEQGVPAYDPEVGGAPESEHRVGIFYAAGYAL